MMRYSVNFARLGHSGLIGKWLVFDVVARPFPQVKCNCKVQTGCDECRIVAVF